MQFADMWEAMSAYTAGGEEAAKATSGQAATLLLEHLKQTSMSLVETREQVPALQKAASASEVDEHGSHGAGNRGRLAAADRVCAERHLVSAGFEGVDFEG